MRRSLSSILQVDLFRFRQHCDGGGGRVDSTLAFGNGHALNAMHAGFPAHRPEHPFALHLEDRFFDAAQTCPRNTRSSRSASPRFSANRVYMRKRSAAKIAASSPPVPARISTIAGRSSSGSWGMSAGLMRLLELGDGAPERDVLRRAPRPPSRGHQRKRARARPRARHRTSEGGRPSRRSVARWRCSLPSAVMRWRVLYVLWIGKLPLDLAGAVERVGEAVTETQVSGVAGRGVASLGGVLLTESFDTAGGVDQLLLAGEERVALRADVRVYLAPAWSGSGRCCRRRTLRSPWRTPDGFRLSFSYLFE